MKRLLNIVFVLICVLASGFEFGALAQSDATAGSSPTANEPSTSVAPPQQTPSADEKLPISKSERSQGAANGAKGSKQAGNAASASSSASAPYVIGPLDVLVIKVWNNTNLSQVYDVRSDGMLSMPLIGEFKADGLTVRELERTLTERLGEFITNPEVNVQVAKVNSKRYFVYGEVLHAGEFPLIEATTVMDALANVGGFKDFANTKKIYIMRGEQRFNFNYKDASKGKNLEQNIMLQNGDRIYVP